jgi:hypothetical protein
VHDGGVGAIPGLYFIGLPFMRRRKSSFIDGVGPDATELVEDLRSNLKLRSPATQAALDRSSAGASSLASVTG